MARWPCWSAHELTKYFVNPHEFAGVVRLLFSEASLASAEINEQTNTASIRDIDILSLFRGHAHLEMTPLYEML